MIDKVYILEEAWELEGSVIQGVYSTQKLAIENGKLKAEEEGGYEDADISGAIGEVWRMTDDRRAASLIVTEHEVVYPEFHAEASLFEVLQVMRQKTESSQEPSSPTPPPNQDP